MTGKGRKYLDDFVMIYRAIVFDKQWKTNEYLALSEYFSARTSKMEIPGIEGTFKIK